MNKPLSEWTLGEIKAECEEHERDCESCPFYSVSHNFNSSSNCKITRRFMNRAPEDWDLSEPPRWTEQDKEDAKEARRLMPWATKVGRGRDYDSLMLNSSVGLHRDLFPSLKPGETVTLDEIIGGGE